MGAERILGLLSKLYQRNGAVQENERKLLDFLFKHGNKIELNLLELRERVFD